MKNAPTTAMIAEKAGVTKAAVSLALRNKPGVSKLTRQRIVQIAKKLHYKPRNGSSALTEQKNRLALWFISDWKPQLNDDIGWSYHSRMQRGIMDYTSQNQIDLVTACSSWQDTRSGNFPAFIKNQQVDGIIIRGWFPEEVEKAVQSFASSVVLVDCDRDMGGSYLQIQIDNFTAVNQLVRYMIERGRRKFAVITGDIEHINTQERLGGMLAGLACHGLEIPKENIIREHGYSEDSGERGASTLLARHCKFDALVCSSDLIALGAARKLQQHHIMIPDDVIIGGFDANPLVKSVLPGLVTVNPQLELIGRTAAQVLNKRICNIFQPQMMIKIPGLLVS